MLRKGRDKRKKNNGSITTDAPAEAVRSDTE